MNELDRLCQLEEHNGLIAKCSVEGMGRRRPFSADFPFNTFFSPIIIIWEHRTLLSNKRRCQTNATPLLRYSPRCG